jgi:hypothetical protein
MVSSTSWTIHRPSSSDETVDEYLLAQSFQIMQLEVLTIKDSIRLSTHYVADTAAVACLFRGD